MFQAFVAPRWRGIGGALLAALTVGLMAGCLHSEDETPTVATPVSLTLSKIGGFEGGTPGAAEITAYDASSKRLFVVNGANGTVDVLDLANPAAPTRLGTINISTLGASVNSVAVHGGLVALAIEGSPKTSAGQVALYRASDLTFLASTQVGALPDMLTFTPDGKRILVANEGEPNSYGQSDSVDPEGSISVIDLVGTQMSVRTADFRNWIGREDELRSAGVRIFGPLANAAQDLEPEYIALSPDGTTAYVTLQENNAMAIVDVANARVTAIKALGYKDYNLAGAGLDASDEDGGTDTNSGTPSVNIVPRPVRGLYLPDGIASYRVGGATYLVTANEGDARADWPGFNEETRVRAHCANGLDPAVFGTDAASLLFDSALGRLRITNAPNGNDNGKNTTGQCTALYAFGGRSFSIWDSSGNRVFDSGDDLEQRTKALSQAPFNSSHDNATLDSRSPSKGPEPEGVALATFGAKTYAFIGMERIGGVMVYDITDPRAPVFTTTVNTRSATTGDRGPEGLTVVSAGDSPSGKPLLIVGNEVSGSTAVYQIDLAY